MANTIILKKSSVAGKIPAAGDLQVGELAVNLADAKLYSKNSAGTVISVGGGSGSGTVTSVGITPSTGVTVSGSPITTSGSITVGLSTKLTAIENLSGAGFITQNGSGVIAGRTIQAGTGISVAHGNGSSQDPVITNSGVTSLAGTANQITASASTGAVTLSLPATINVNTSGSAATLTTARTIQTNLASTTAASFNGSANITPGVTGTLPLGNGGTGSTTAAGARTSLGATTVGGNLFTLTNPSAITFPRINADNSISTLSAANFRTAIGAGTGNGTVTSVGITAGTGISVSGSPITSSGSMTVTNSDRGSSQNIFKNIAVSGQSTIVADNNDDTLTIAAGTGITLTTNATTDTLTISAAGSTGQSMNYDQFTAAAGQTTFSPSASYTSGKIQVFKDGVLMRNGVDVTVTSGTSVVFVAACDSGDLIDFVYPPAASSGTMRYDQFTATASQTTFTTSATYTSGKIQVFVDGVLQRNNVDVTVTSGTTIVFATGLAAGDLVDVTYPV